ncbi:hypothetical protein FA048_19620 [Pedobacter polaris]|uniref:Uncharacterized protein n=1 Tax=Pedobacter polaris TaxID=2571273 RepID=A0A4U1CCV4_9SPHI|nr:hypothetical protein [Pedobacter polaris]TKC04097.1 hypothetical protein FA048_19620 [Pedobacter polaris]
MEKLKRNRLEKGILVVFSAYMLLSGIISIGYLIAVLTEKLINDVIGWISITTCILIALITIVNNFYILRLKFKTNRIHYGINIFLCLIQTFYLVFDGFQYKYNQGIEIVIYFKIINDPHEFLLGHVFRNFNFGFTMKFYESAYSLVGLNLISLCLFLFFLLKYKQHNVLEKV